MTQTVCKFYAEMVETFLEKLIFLMSSCYRKISSTLLIFNKLLRHVCLFSCLWKMLGDRHSVDQQERQHLEDTLLKTRVSGLPRVTKFHLKAAACCAPCLWEKYLFPLLKAVFHSQAWSHSWCLPWPKKHEYIYIYFIESVTDFFL